MSGSKKGTFAFRMSADDAEKVVAQFKKAAQGSDELKAAYDRLIQSSPQLASVNDGVQRKMRETAESMKNTQAAGTSLAGTMGRAGVLGFAIGAGTEAFSALVEKIKETYEAIPKAGDEVKLLTARLANVTGSTELAVQAYGKLNAVARTTGASLGDTVDTFQRMSLAAKDLGGTTDQVIALVEGVQKFGIVSGAGPQALSAASQQLGQALASGRLQGDELRSIMENMPELAAALAQQLGVSLGALRQMGSEGKLTADVVFPAMLRAVEGIDERFRAMPLTVERAGNAASTATNQLLGHVDKLLGLSNSIAAKWQTIAELMDRARRYLGGETGVEAATAREARIAAIDSELAGLYGPQRPRSTTGYDIPRPESPRAQRERVAELEAERSRLLTERRMAATEDSDLRDADRRAALLRGREGAQARSREGLRDVLDLDPKVKAARERDEAKSKLDEGLRLGTVTQRQYETTARIIEDRYTKAIAGGTAAVREHTEATAEFLKEREKIDAAAKAVEMSLDPYAQAWQKAAEQVEALTKAMELWESTQGAMGLDPEKGPALMAKITDGLATTYERLGKAGEKTDNTFQQFFSNQVSGLESAIAKGGQYRDLLKGLQQDISLMLTRTFITGPLMKAGSDFMDKQGGLSGLAKSGFDWLASQFADGGVMTDRGPLQLQRYASGGIADRPQLALFGEGRTPEAYVPLPNGRSIPVDLRGGGRGDTNITVHVNSSNASPQLIATTVALAVDESRRSIYGDADRGGAAAKKLGRRR